MRYTLRIIQYLDSTILVVEGIFYDMIQLVYSPLMDEITLPRVVTITQTLLQSKPTLHVTTAPTLKMLCETSLIENSVDQFDLVNIRNLLEVAHALALYRLQSACLIYLYEQHPRILIAHRPLFHNKGDAAFQALNWLWRVMFNNNDKKI